MNRILGNYKNAIGKHCYSLLFMVCCKEHDAEIYIHQNILRQRIQINDANQILIKVSPF